MGLAHQGIQGRGEAERDAESEAVPAELGGRKIRDAGFCTIRTYTVGPPSYKLVYKPHELWL
jgi:hypothetical protein